MAGAEEELEEDDDDADDEEEVEEEEADDEDEDEDEEAENPHDGLSIAARAAAIPSGLKSQTRITKRVACASLFLASAHSARGHVTYSERVRPNVERERSEASA